MLQKKGYDVHAFNDSSQALKHIQSCKDCSIVISDIIMPEMTGVELAIHVKKAKPEIKFVLTSAMPIDRKDWRKILPASNKVDDFIAKPFSMKEIAEIIRKYGKEQSQQNGL
jgi:DNA-binding NtrC family response regulator